MLNSLDVIVWDFDGVERYVSSSLQHDQPALFYIGDTPTDAAMNIGAPIRKRDRASFSRREKVARRAG
jgi:hypothetical protein